MIPDYKFYHGAVLAELVDTATVPLSIDELREEGRLTSYIVNQKIGLHIKHSTSRLSPWQFTINLSNIRECFELRKIVPHVFLVLVCWKDGMVVVNLADAAAMISGSANDQAWLRAERRRGKWYSVNGNGDQPAVKKPQGVSEILETLEAAQGKVFQAAAR